MDEMPFIYDVQEKIRRLGEIRARAGEQYTQHWLAERLGVHKSQVCRWEKGEQYPNGLVMLNLIKLIDYMQLEYTKPDPRKW